METCRDFFYLREVITDELDQTPARPFSRGFAPTYP